MRHTFIILSIFLLSLTIVSCGSDDGGSSSSDNSSSTTTTSSDDDSTTSSELFVGVGNSGTIVTSSGGSTLDTRTSGTTESLTGVTYGNGIFVAVGGSGTILTSSDGITWTIRTSGIGETLRAVTYGNGTFVAVGSYAVILSSTDGITWTNRSVTYDGNKTLDGITYGKGLFVTVGYRGVSWVSSDGITWTYVNTRGSSGLGGMMFGVTYGNGLYIAVGESRVIITSDNGTSWTQRKSSESGSVSFFGVGYGNGLYNAVGSYGVIYGSSNGTTWTQKVSGSTASLNKIAYGNSTYVVVGSEIILTSSDGTSWTSYTTDGMTLNDAIYKKSSYDTTAPVIAEVTSVTTPTNDNTPNYTFSSDEAGTITYGGSCSSSTKSATTGNNTITLNSLSDGTYSDCTISVFDASGNVSNSLTIKSFIVDRTAASLVEVIAVTTPTNDNTPNYTFSSSEAGTITYGGSCSSSTTSAITDNNTITLNSLSEGTYSNCTISVTDNVSNSVTLNISSFVIDKTAPRVSSISPTDNQSGVSVTDNISVTFSEAIDNTSVTSNTSSTSCSGSIQLSSDNFSSCIQMSSSPSSSNSEKTFTIDPSSNFSLSTTYKIRVTTGVKDNAGNNLSAQWSNTNGFQTTSWNGTQVLGTTRFETGRAVQIDSSGNIYITGDTQQAFSGDGLDGNTSAGGYDIFLVKYNSNGIKQWTQQLGTSSIDRGYDLTIDSSNNIYVTGVTVGGLDGNISSGDSDIFLAKYYDNGTKQWTKQLGTSSGDAGLGLAIDSSNNIYITGYTSGGLDGTNSGNQDVFLAKYYDNGTKQWTKQLGTSSGEQGKGVAVDSSDNIYVTGSTYGGLDGNSNSGSSDIFLVKYYDNGTKQWTQQLGTSGSDVGYRVTVDNSSNIYITGYTAGGLDGNTNAGGWDIFLVKYNSSGTKQWTKQLGTSEGDLGDGVVVDFSNNVYVTGSSEEELDGNVHSGQGDIILAKYYDNGTKQWTKQMGTSSFDGGQGITVDNSSNIYITGYTRGDLDGNTLSGSDADMFLLKYNSDGDLQ